MLQNIFSRYIVWRFHAPKGQWNINIDNIWHVLQVSSSIFCERMRQYREIAAMRPLLLPGSKGESVAFPVCCHRERSHSHLGVEIEQWLYPAVAIAGCGSGIWRCVLFSIAGFAYHTGGNRLRNLVRRGHHAYNSRRLAYAGTIPRRARYPRIGAYRCWGGRPERILEDNG